MILLWIVTLIPQLFFILISDKLSEFVECFLLFLCDVHVCRLVCDVYKKGGTYRPPFSDTQRTESTSSILSLREDIRWTFVFTLRTVTGVVTVTKMYCPSLFFSPEKTDSKIDTFFVPSSFFSMNRVRRDSRGFSSVKDFNPE